MSFPTRIINGVEALSETPTDPTGDWKVHFGFPRDLDADGIVDGGGTDFSTSYKVLPVIVTVTWEGVRGTETLTLRHIFISRTSS